MNREELKLEWSALQREFDSYEKHSLYIKLISIVMLLAAIAFNMAGYLLIQVLIVTWLLDAMWKTYQARMEVRLLKVEQALYGECEDVMPFQFNSEFLSGRGGVRGLLSEYLNSALRPTVALPYPLLVLIALQV